MSSAAQSGPRSGRGGSRGQARGRGRGAPRGRRANFGGSLTNNASSSTRAAAADSNPNNHTQAEHDHDHDQDHQHDNQAQQPASNDNDELPPEVELCFICAEPVKLYSVAPCEHRTCHICAIRLRALYKKTDCTFCKTPIERLIFTASATKMFSEFQPQDTPHSDDKLNISFETKDAMEETLILLRFNCPDPRCEIASIGWNDLRMHVKRDHSRLVCDLCIRHKKIFAHEHTLHTNQSLNAHMEKEHGLCEYCKQYFYGDDELFVHMRDRHEQCHICKARGSEAERWKYFRDYRMLERHFQNNHFACMEPECLEKKFVVFENEMDFKAHQLSEHSNKLSSKEKREALRIEANFTYDGESSRGAGGGPSGSGSGSGSGGRSGMRGGRNGARARSNPGTDREVSDSESGQASASRTNVPGAGASTRQSRRAMFGGNLTNGIGSNTPTPQGVTAPADSAPAASVEERHKAYLAKVERILKGSTGRLESFRASVRVYRNGEMSARDLVDNIYSLVGEMDDCAPVVNGLVDLFDDEDKKRDVVAAWNGLRVQRTQFPSLVPTTNANTPISGGNGYAGMARGQIRNVKNTSSSGSQVWLNVDRAASASSGHRAGKPSATREHFPSLSSAQSAGSVRVPGSLAHAVASTSRVAGGSSTPWAGSASASAPRSAVAAAPAPYVARASGSGGTSVNVVKNTAAFPSLPSNAKAASIQAQKRALFNRGSSASSPGGSGTSTPWSASAAAGAGLSSLDGLSDALEEEERVRAGEGSGKGKKKKNKGVQLMTLGGVHRG